MSSFSPVPLSIVSAGDVREPALLETSLALLTEYVARAPQWRIERWSFAATAGGRALVRGLPLPPLPGTRWLSQEGICVPAGSAWSPAIEPAILRRLLSLETGEIALLGAGATWDRVAADAWVRCSRSALRQREPGPGAEALKT
jgi:hypothetical protein